MALKYQWNQNQNNLHIADSPSLDDAIKFTCYKAANLQEIADSCIHLSDDEQQSLHMLLNEYNSISCWADRRTVQHWNQQDTGCLNVAFNQCI